ncbi:Transposase IS116/IS110/IS902 family protein [Boseongicola aestuarii]|uniref:Transposase IS116/IS110/IS902 family protein n=1 Tax=Boseongicola aestuarii TaxID=1470561 RepID=A0A238J0W3_9RHOB|nr:Transposase IS116/IS110/IS902 family protein [Boseongicola aestuarii]
MIELVARLRDDGNLGLSEVAQSALLALAEQLESLAARVRAIETQLLAWHWQNAASQRLETIPGVGIITATAFAASVPDPAVFKSGRQFAAYIGLEPR